MPWGDKAVSPCVYTPGAGDASGWVLDDGVLIREGKILARSAFPARNKLLFEFMAEDITDSTLNALTDTSGNGNHISNVLFGSTLSLSGSGADRYVHFDRTAAFSRATVGTSAVAFMVAKINTDTVPQYSAMADSDDLKQFLFSTTGDGAWFDPTPKYINGVANKMPMKQKVLVHVIAAWGNIYVGADRTFGSSRAPDFNLYSFAIYSNLSSDEITAVKSFVANKYGLVIT